MSLVLVAVEKNIKNAAVCISKKFLKSLRDYAIT